MTGPAPDRTTGWRRRSPLIALAVPLLLAGAVSCSGTETDGEPRKSASPTETAMPQGLVGAWESALPGSNTTFAYRFTAEGKYKYFGMTSYPTGEQEVYELVHVVEGTYEASTDTLTLRPRSAGVTRKNPDDPEGDYTNSPAPLETQRYRWRVADRTLSLTRADGVRFVFEWVSP
ncbi:hypothetical protein [Streptomyces caelestis]|uniref:hypothetical protein n=1 Tax=Streptomyces caelestis TaxID=36816 RepID=UPI003665C085